jgi:predicted dinucleotide-binding enzyme
MSTTSDAVYSPERFAAPAAPRPVSTVTIFGAGRVGTALARALVASGHEVRVVGSGDSESIRLIVDVLAPGARAMTPTEAVAGADVIIVAIPLHKIDTLDPAVLDGAIVVDVMNFWAPIDGDLPEFADSTEGTSPRIAARWPGARVVKAFNHIGYHDIEGDRQPAGSPERRALAVSSDDHEAAATVMSLVDDAGFDALYAGPLSTGVALEAGGEIFGVRLGRDELARLLAGH